MRVAAVVLGCCGLVTAGCANVESLRFDTLRLDCRATATLAPASGNLVATTDAQLGQLHAADLVWKSPGEPIKLSWGCSGTFVTGDGKSGAVDFCAGTGTVDGEPFTLTAGALRPVAPLVWLEACPAGGAGCRRVTPPCAANDVLDAGFPLCQTSCRVADLGMVQGTLKLDVPFSPGGGAPVERRPIAFTPSFRQLLFNESLVGIQPSEIFTVFPRRVRPGHFAWSPGAADPPPWDVNFSPTLRIFRIRAFEISRDGGRRPLVIGAITPADRPLFSDICGRDPADPTQVTGDSCRTLADLTPAYYIDYRANPVDWDFGIDDPEIAADSDVAVEFVVGSLLAEDALPDAVVVPRQGPLTVAVGSPPRSWQSVFRVHMGSAPNPWTIRALRVEGSQAGLVSELRVEKGPSSPTLPFTVDHAGAFWVGVTLTSPAAPSTGSIALNVDITSGSRSFTLASTPVAVAAIAPPNLNATPSVVRFTDSGTDDPRFPWRRWVFLSNTSAVPVQGSLRLDGPDRRQFSLDRASTATLSQSGMEVVTIAYCPRTRGPHTAELRISTPGAEDAVVRLETVPWPFDFFPHACATLLNPIPNPLEPPVGLPTPRGPR